MAKKKEIAMFAAIILIVATGVFLFWHNSTKAKNKELLEEGARLVQEHNAKKWNFPLNEYKKFTYVPKDPEAELAELVGDDGSQIVIKEKDVADLISNLATMNSTNDSAEDWLDFKRQCVSAYCSQIAMNTKFEQAGVTSNEDEIQKLWEESVSARNTEEEFLAYLDNMNVTEEFYRNYTLRNLNLYNNMREKCFKEVGEPTEEECKKYYEKHYYDYNTPAETKFRYLVFSTEEEAEKALTSLKNEKELYSELLQQALNKDNEEETNYISVTGDESINEFPELSNYFNLENDSVIDKVYKNLFNYNDSEEEADYYFVLQAVYTTEPVLVDYDDIKTEIEYKCQDEKIIARINTYMLDGSTTMYTYYSLGELKDVGNNIDNIRE